MSGITFTEPRIFEVGWKKASDPSFWAFTELNTDLFDNQIETVNAVCDKSIKGLAILQARGAGKTFAVAVGLLILCLSHVGLKVGVFGPTEDQATRIIKEIRENILTPGLAVYQKVNWANKLKSRFVFLNGSVIEAMSASESTQQEGWHFNIIVVDEAHRVSDEAFSQRLFPMTSGMEIGKVIKIGIPIGKGHFYKSCTNGQYKLIKKGWLECPILLRNGSFFYQGQEYPEAIANALSLPLKQEMFPDRPDLHFEGEIGEFEFKTQFSMEWADDTFLELKTEDREKLVSGNHSILSQGTAGEEYYFGLDTAPGTQKEMGKDLDFTVLSIWRKRHDNVKEKVFCKEWRGNIVGQFEEIEQLIHPKTGIFKCRFGIADRSNIAQSLVAFFQKKASRLKGSCTSRATPYQRRIIRTRYSMKLTSSWKTEERCFLP